MNSRGNDPVIDEIRETRHQISASVGHDPRRLVEYYVRQQEQHRNQVLGEQGAAPKVIDPPSSSGSAPPTADPGC
jgi:hypothetical protein